MAVRTGNERVRLAPGPTGLDGLRWIGALRRDPLRTLPAAVHRWGDVVRFRIPPGRGHREFVLVAHPDGVQQVLQGNHRNYRRPRTYDILKQLLGGGLLTSEGDEWRRHRRLVQPAFHRDVIARLTTSMVAATEEMLEGWKAIADASRSFDAAREMQGLALDIVGRTLFTSGLAEHADAVADVLEISLDTARVRMRSPLPPDLPRPDFRERALRRAIERFDAVVHRLISARRADRDPPHDLLTMLLRARDEETGEGMSDREIRDELVTFMLAGHETTANALAWSFYLLSTHPRVRDLLEAEVDAALDGRTPDAEDLSSLVYTRQVVNEAMRLYPPAWVVERAAVSDDEIGGHLVPAGAMVMASPWITHRHVAIWEDPEAFVPERFAEEPSRDRHRFAHFPFGGGPRLCIGRDFALTEAVLVLAAVTRRYRLDVLPGFPVQPKASVTLRPLHGVRVTLRRR